jgi:hypothetical protein
MDISKYTDYFHDGYVNNIRHVKNNLFIFLESAVIEDVSQIGDKDYISDSHTFRGTLNLYNIKKITLGGKRYEGVFRMEYDDGDILDFEINGHQVFLLIEWKNFPPKIRKTDVSKIEIEAEKIEWVPDL